MEAPAAPFIPADIVLLTAPQVDMQQNLFFGEAVSEFAREKLIGMMFNWGLWGVLTVQVYIYYLYFKDSARVRILVYSLYFLETLQTALSSADIVHWFAVGWGQLDFLSDPYIAPFDMPLMSGLTAMIVQLYFSWRIWILSKSMPLVILIVAVSIAQGISGLVAGIQAFKIGNLTKFSGLLAPKLWLGGAALSDTLIAITMCYYLYRAKQRTMGLHIQKVLVRVITITVETNSVSATVAILTLVLFVRFPNNTLYLCPPYVLGKLYTNTLMAIFNNRIVLPQHGSTIANAMNLNVLKSGSNAAQNSEHVSRVQDNGIKVTVLRETEGGHSDTDLDLEEQRDGSLSKGMHL